MPTAYSLPLSGLPYQYGAFVHEDEEVHLSPIDAQEFQKTCGKN
jgi:hypothetical protein